MTKEIMIPILQAVGITEWRNAGFTGKGIKVYNCEENSGHGASSGQMVRDVAPDVEVTFGNISFGMRGDELTSEPRIISKNVSLKELIETEKPHIVTVSKSGGYTCLAWDNYIKDIQSNQDIPFFNAGANEGSGDGETLSTFFPIQYCIVVGALDYINGNFVRAGYSSVGKELDFSQSVGWWSGTSSATPFLAGMSAIIMQRFGTMGNEELYKYLVMISKDLGTSGRDTYYGYGQPILPPLSKKYITMKTTSKDYFVNGLKFTMDTNPVNKNGTVFVPIRVISETLGATVNWKVNSDKTIHIIIERGTTKLEMTTGSNVVIVNGLKKFLDNPVFIDSNNRTLVPIRVISEAFGCVVDWVQSENKVMILEK